MHPTETLSCARYLRAISSWIHLYGGHSSTCCWIPKMIANAGALAKDKRKRKAG